MKKFLAIVFTLIFALSACTVAFAADAANVFTCANCGEKYDTTTAYNEHIKTCKPAASVPQTWMCDRCQKVFKDEAALNDHYFAGGCDVTFEDCKYCGERIFEEGIEKHYNTCIKFAETCAYCGKDDFANYDEFAAHEDGNCKVINAIGDKIKVAEIVNKIIEFLKGVDWAGLFAKVGELVGGIDFEGLIGKVTGFIGGIDFEGLLGKVSGAVEGLGK